MAVITTSGRVFTLKFGDDYGHFILVNALDLKMEFFTLWYNDDSAPGPVALYTMLLTVAAARNLTVTLDHEETSPYPNQIALNP